ncbi:MAG: molybdopterin-guanine dinucleotide biosynthesis protein B [Gemmatimonadota bacterium]|nr:molybdopterin-guanine dinucleotide biosynthesis protein B [Gemmatimonadota bacterium]
MVSIVGRKNSGKTTLLVRLAAELRRRGHRVMTIKHGAHTFNIDPATTDTYRHYHEGGAEKVAMVAPDKFALVERLSAEPAPEEVAERYMGDADIVLCEGFKRSALPKIEVFRQVVHADPLYAVGSPEAELYLTVVSDVAEPPVACRVILMSDPDWLHALAALVEREVMQLP